MIRRLRVAMMKPARGLLVSLENVIRKVSVSRTY